MEKNERSTDSRIKTGIQNLLGGLVLLTIPLGTITVVGMWRTLSVHSVQLSHQSSDHSALFQRVVSLETFKHKNSDHKELLQRVHILELFKSKTQSNRFRASDGKRLENKIDNIDEARHNHDTAAEGWIAIIKRNTEIIKSNQTKAHTHQWRGPKGENNSR